MRPPGLENILSESYGLPAYQEQIMQIGDLVGLNPKDSDKHWKGHYAFNKSHSVCYTLLAFRCAWLKAHYPEEYAQAYRAFYPEH